MKDLVSQVFSGTFRSIMQRFEAKQPGRADAARVTATLEQVVAHYNTGGRSKDPNLDPLMQPLKLSAREQADLVEFMKSLTDKRLDQIQRPGLP